MGYTPREEWQKVLINLSDGHTVDPAFLQDYYITNLVNRAYSYLFAWDETRGLPVKLVATSSGLLKVSALPPVRDTYEVFHQTIAAGGTVTITFTEAVTLVEIWTYGADMLIEKSTDGAVFGGQVKIPAGSYWSFESTTKALRITNTDTLNAQDVQVVGWR